MKHRLLRNRDDIKLQFLNASMHAGLGRAALGSSEPSADQLTATHAMKIHAEARHLVTHGQSSAIAHRSLSPRLRASPHPARMTVQDTAGTCLEMKARSS